MSKQGSRGGQNCLLAERNGALLTLAINRPDANNAINNDMRDTLIEAFEAAARDSTLRVIVLTSVGDDAFSVGTDVAEIATYTPAEAEALGEQVRKVYQALNAIDVPVVAAIKGACLGAGFELALHADLRLARGDARFGLPGINIGLVSSGAALGRLQRLCGVGSAAALALTGGMVTAERAFMLGLVSNVTSSKDFAPALEQLALHFSALSPVAVVETKRMLRAAADGGLEVASALGPKALARCFGEGDALARLHMMLGGRDPQETLH
jgi:enoyl-CoA hydratase/carnithine racemase